MCAQHIFLGKFLTFHLFQFHFKELHFNLLPFLSHNITNVTDFIKIQTSVRKIKKNHVNLRFAHKFRTWLEFFYQIDLILELFFKRIKANFGIFLKHFTDVDTIHWFQNKSDISLKYFDEISFVSKYLHDLTFSHKFQIWLDTFFFKILLVLEQFHKSFNGHFPIVFKHIKNFINDQEITQKYFNKILFIQ
jgi:hypothetical protein